MRKISINKLIKIYEKLIDNDSISESIKIDKFNYLNLSILFSRDEREFDIHNYKLLKNLNLEKIDPLLKNNKNKNLISGYEKYFKIFKETKYLLNRKLPLIFFIDIFKLIIQLVDITFITLIIIFMQSINLFTSNIRGINLKNKKIYSIYYWKGKSSKSGIYYYPEINNSLENKAFISSFADTKYFSHGLIHSLLNSKFASPERTINLKGLT